MERQGIVIAAWSGVAGLVLFGLGIGPLVANFLPPPAPSLSAANVAAMYREHGSAIQFGAILVMFAAAFLCMFYGGISALMRRMERRVATFTFAQAVSAAIATVPFFLAAMTWGVAAFRPDRSDDAILLLNDIAWIFLISPVAGGTVQLMAIGLAILGDSSDKPLIDRWVGYLSIWVAILFLPGAIIFFFKHGAFAWNGIFGFWLGAVAFGIWTAVMCHAMMKAAKHRLPE